MMTALTQRFAVQRIHVCIQIYVYWGQSYKMTSVTTISSVWVDVVTRKDVLTFQSAIRIAQEIVIVLVHPDVAVRDNAQMRLFARGIK